MRKLDSKPYLNKVAKAGKLADKVLRHHGSPKMSLAELRAALDRELKDLSLSEYLIKQREAGW